MDSFLPSFSPLNISPQTSTEEKSIHDNFDLNKQNLEKGLQNRPSQGYLVDRGILQNPGKAYPDKMQQLKYAKMKDKLKGKLKARPTLDELIKKKIIIEDSVDDREKEKTRIKEVLSNSMQHRPGSLELIDKNILQMGRLLASKVQSGEIDYPKVDYNSIDINQSLVELSALTEQISGSQKSIPNNNNNNNNNSNNNTKQISFVKTGKMGKFSFHNAKIQPQKAREIQQDHMINFQEIQEERGPNLMKLHSELRNRHNDKEESTKTDSLMHRLNVSELKNECKLRKIPHSNIPKAELVEKLLPFEEEILSNRKFTTRKSNNSSNTNNILNNSVNNGTEACSNFTLQNNIMSGQFMEIKKIQNQNKINHSASEPVINVKVEQNRIVSAYRELVFPSNNRYSVGITEDISQINPIQHGCYSSFNLSLPCHSQSYMSDVNNDYSLESLEPVYILNNVSNVANEPLSNVQSCNNFNCLNSNNSNISSLQRICNSIPIGEKFTQIKKELDELSQIIFQQQNLKNGMTNGDINDIYMKSLQNLLNTTKETIEFVGKELKFNTIPQLQYDEEMRWLTEFYKEIERMINEIKMDFTESIDDSSNNLDEYDLRPNYVSMDQIPPIIDDLNSLDFLTPDKFGHFDELNTPEYNRSPVNYNEDYFSSQLFY